METKYVASSRRVRVSQVCISVASVGNIRPGAGTSNIQHSTSNIQCQTRRGLLLHRMFEVGCWMFDVFPPSSLLLFIGPGDPHVNVLQRMPAARQLAQRPASLAHQRENLRAQVNPAA